MRINLVTLTSIKQTQITVFSLIHSQIYFCGVGLGTLYGGGHIFRKKGILGELFGKYKESLGIKMKK